MYWLFFLAFHSFSFSPYSIFNNHFPLLLLFNHFPIQELRTYSQNSHATYFSIYVWIFIISAFPPFMLFSRFHRVHIYVYLYKWNEMNIWEHFLPLYVHIRVNSIQNEKFVCKCHFVIFLFQDVWSRARGCIRLVIVNMFPKTFSILFYRVVMWRGKKPPFERKEATLDCHLSPLPNSTLRLSITYLFNFSHRRDIKGNIL